MKKLLVTLLLIMSMLLIACRTRDLGSDSAPMLGEPAGDTAGAADQAGNGEAAIDSSTATEGESTTVESGETGESAGDSGEAAAAGGEAAADGGEAGAADGGEAGAAADGGEGDAAAADGGEAAADGGEATAEGDNSGGDAAAADGGEATAEGGEAAADGGEAAAEGGEAAADGGEAAADGGEGEAGAADGGEAAADSGEAAPANANAGEQTHVVQYGDTVGEIAQAYNVTVEDIQAANGLPNINAIEVGQELKIVAGAAGDAPVVEEPAPASQFDPDRYVTHIISYGQTLFSIGQAYGFTVDELAAFNNITDPTRIDTGQVLKIPIR